MKFFYALVFVYFSISSYTFASTFVQVASANGTLIVNQITGSINYCNGLNYLSNNAVPIGHCAQIGSINKTSLNGNIQINVVSGLSGIITNLSTGDVAQCSLVANLNGVPIGSCESLKVN